MTKPLYKRIVIKFSGEFFGKSRNQNTAGKYEKTPSLDNTLNLFISQIKDAKKSSLETAVVVGGGNIIRGLTAEKSGMDRYSSDYMGMIGTLINALYLKSTLAKNGIGSSVMSSLQVKNICPLFSKEGALKLLNKGEILILAGGTGNPYFTTDTAAALKAVELEADVLLKGTKVDGVYTSDPVTNPKAKKFERLTYKEVIEKNLKVMDLTAVSLCRENKLPIIVFNIQKSHSIKRLLKGEKIGTIIK
jgi:uridylate kinase